MYAVPVCSIVGNIYQNVFIKIFLLLRTIIMPYISCVSEYCIILLLRFLMYVHVYQRTRTHVLVRILMMRYSPVYLRTGTATANP